MFKKVAIGSLAAAAVGTFVFGRDAWSYLTTSASSVREAVRSEVPVEFEIERAKKQVEQLVPEIRKSMHVIATEQVQVEHLQESIAQREKALGDQEEAIMALSAHLKSGETRFVVHGRTYRASEVQRDLADRFNRFKVAEEALKADQETLNARNQALSAHRETLESMLSQRKSLEVELERLEARVRTIEARKTISELNIDDSHLARCKALIREIDGKLDVEEKLLDADANFAGLIPIEKETAVPEDILDQVDSYFGEQEGTNVEEPLAASAL
jgi:chromosome segregation ATPase